MGRVIKCKRVFIWQSAGSEWLAALSSLAHIIGPNDGELSVMQSDVEGHSGLLQIELLPAAHKL